MNDEVQQTKADLRALLGAAQDERQDWHSVGLETASVSLAVRHHYSASDVALLDIWPPARVRAESEWVIVRFVARSERTGRYEYAVHYDPRADRVMACACPADEHGRPCKHKGAARLWIEAEKQRIAGTARPSRRSRPATSRPATSRTRRTRTYLVIVRSLDADTGDAR